jgi:Ca2+-binding EF-hand superfamily protein
MALVNFVPDFSLEEKCRLAFKMYDVDFSGYVTIDIIESVLMSTNLVSTRHLVKKRAGTFMACADKDGLGHITVDEFILGAQKLPNLIFPKYVRNEEC